MFAVSDGISLREFARREACSDTLVRRAVKQGKLRAFDDGTLSPTLVGTGWRKENRKAANSANKPANTVRTVRTDPPAEEVDRAADEMFSEEADNFLDKVLSGQFADQGHAERIKENALAAKHLLAARKDAGNLVEIELAERILFETQRSQRDAWINFPTRIGPLLAAELGMEADKVVEALTAHVHQQLDDLGEPEADFTGQHSG